MPVDGDDGARAQGGPHRGGAVGAPHPADNRFGDTVAERGGDGIESDAVIGDGDRGR